MAGPDKFAVVIHSEPSGGYWGEVPALPGCRSQGETVEQLMANLREAIASTLETREGSDNVGEALPQAVKPGVADDRKDGGSDPEGREGS